MDLEVEKLVENSFPEKFKIKSIYYKGVYMCDRYETIADAVENFEIYDDDIWVCTYPKTGSTWTQEMIWNIVHNCDFEGAKALIESRVPFFEAQGTATTEWLNKLDFELNQDFYNFYLNSLEYSRDKPRPRIFKTHLPFHLLPRQLRIGETKAKIIYTTRNVKDVCISYYHFYKLYKPYQDTFEHFATLFLNDKVFYTPFWNHVIGYWQRRNDENVLLIRFEDMKNDLKSIIKKTTNFLEKSLTDQQTEDLSEHLRFENMKNNSATNFIPALEFAKENKVFGEDAKYEGTFMRCGQVGQWRTEMSNDMNKRFDDWIKEKLKNHTDILNELID